MSSVHDFLFPILWPCAATNVGLFNLLTVAFIVAIVPGQFLRSLLSPFFIFVSVGVLVLKSIVKILIRPPIKSFYPCFPQLIP